MGSWLKRNTSKKKYVFNHEHERMDQILEALVLSQHHDKVKEEVFSRICGQASQPQSEATIRGVLHVSSKWILHGTTALQVSSGFKLFNAWGSHNFRVFETFFTPTLVVEILTQASGIPANVPLLLREGFCVLSHVGPSVYYEHAQMVQSNITKFICGSQEQMVVRNVALLLEEVTECIPSSESEVINFCLVVLKHLSVGVPPNPADEMFTQHTDEIAKCLGIIWLQSQFVLGHCLLEIFSIISVARTEEQPYPAISLASVVKHIPIEIANKAVKDIVTDPTIIEESIATAVGQIVNWLNWPTAQYVDLWLLCLLTELSAAQKYSLLSFITESYVDQVVAFLARPDLRHASFRILSHMLLGFQHSPAPFHKCLEKLSSIIRELRDERTAQAEKFLTQMSQLVCCLMYQHTGFPELYGPVLELLKGCRQPDVEQIKAILDQAKWSSQTTCCIVMKADVPSFSITSIKPEKLEPGKTGLDNLGNTCYMNSVVQALYMCDQFRRGVLGKAPKGTDKLLVKLQHVFAHLSQSNRPAITPSKFLQESRPPWFLPGHQQDCSEFLKHLLNQLHEEEKSSNQSGPDKIASRASISSTATIKARMDTLSKSERKTASVMLTAVKMKTEEEMNGPKASETPSSDSEMNSKSVKSIVEKTFRGKVQTTLRCVACKQESTTVESFVDIPLAFPNSSVSSMYPHKSLAGGGGAPAHDTEAESMQVAEAEHANPSDECFSLNDLISFYLRPEKLIDDNKYHCDKCRKLQDGEKRIQIIESPQYLILTLLRFSYDTKLQSRTKIFQDVRYPRTLSIPVCSGSASKDSKSRLSKRYSKNNRSSSYRSSGVAAGQHLDKLDEIARLLAPNSENCNRSCRTHLLYGLSGVIIHSGMSSESGHYYCYARHSQAGQVNAGFLDNFRGDLDNFDLLPDKWYNFNDSKVSRATFDSFSNLTKKFSKDTPYVLIYRKLDFSGQGCGLDTDFDLRPDLRDAVIKDNEAYLREQEMEARHKEQQRRRRSSTSSTLDYYARHGKSRDDDDDDNADGGSYGFGGFDNGLDISGTRYVF